MSVNFERYSEVVSLYHDFLDKSYSFCQTDSTLKFDRDLFGMMYEFWDAFPEDLNESKYRPNDHSYNFSHLKIEVSEDRMQEVFRKYGVLLLREIPKDCKKLVVGCGNSPISLSSESTLPLGHAYPLEHQHEDAITMDPDLTKNPTIVGFWGLQRLWPLLETKKYSVEFEGVELFGTPCTMPYTLSELKRISLT